MVQPIDNACAIEGVIISQPLSGVELPNRNIEFSLRSVPRESYLVSSPWIGKSGTVVPNKEGQLTLNGQSDTTVAPVVQPLSVDISRQNARVQALQRWTGIVEKIIGDRLIA